jgi:hypothetical protein
MSKLKNSSKSNKRVNGARQVSLRIFITTAGETFSKSEGPFGSSGFKTGACQIDPFSKSGDFETGRIDHSGFEIGEVVRLPPGFKTGVTPSFGSLI